MKTAVFIIAVLGASKAFLKGQEELPFKRLYVGALGPSPEKTLPKITNGHEVVAHSIPFQAYLIVTGKGNTGKWICGGSLISPSYVLTAGHCVADATSVEVYLGAHNIQKEESTRIVITSENLIAHELFDISEISNDIGLIELPTPVELNENINVASLPSLKASSSSYEGSNARVSGWGYTIGGGKASPVLMEVNSTVISNSLCNSYYENVKDYQVCISGAGGVGSCYGDSGGPLIVDNEQIGIVSYGVMGCMPEYPSGSTRTASFLDWLEAHTDLKFQNT